MKKYSKAIFAINFMGSVISRAVFLGVNPIGLGFFGAAYTIKQGRFLGILLACLGMATVLSPIELMKYIIILVVTSILIGLYEIKGKEAGVYVTATILGVVTTLITCSTVYYYHKANEQMLVCILEGVITFAFVILFQKGISFLLECKRNCIPDNEQLISISFLIGAMIYSLADVQIGGVLICVVLAYFAMLFFAYKYGAGFGAVIGTVSGIALCVRLEDYSLIGMLCMLGIIIGMFREFGRMMTALAYAIGIVCIGLYQGQYIAQMVHIEAKCMAGILFLLLPAGLIRRVDVAGKKNEVEDFAKDNVETITTHKLKEFSKSFVQLSKTFREITQKRMSFHQGTVVEMIDELSSQICANCEKCDLCWKNNYSTTYKNLEAVVSTIEEKGGIERKEVSKEFHKQCTQVNYLINEGVRMFETFKLNSAWQNRLAESREAIAGQLDEVATIIDEFSDDLYRTSVLSDQMEHRIKAVLKANRVHVSQLVILEKRDKRKQVYLIGKAGKGQCIPSKEIAAMIGSVMNLPMKPTESTKNVMTKSYDTFAFVEDTAFKAFTGSARVTKYGEKISGDNFSILSLEDGQMILSLSDGMGTGMNASEESESVIELLEQFMEAGFREESAIRLINSILVLKSEDQSFSTIDLSMLNLYTGVCEFVKIGAATTFIKRDHWVETISSTSMPAGVFNQVDFDQKSKKLYDGDYIIMMSDGVLDCIKGEEKESTMQEIIHGLTSVNPQEMANQIIQAALHENNEVPIDDMTVLVAGIWKK